MPQARSGPTWQPAAAAGDAAATAGVPRVRRISFADVRAALAEGVDDFRAMPRHVLFLGLVYAVVCLLLVGFTFGRDLVPLVFPMVSGFALLGPFAAVGLYELSRRRERGEDTMWWHTFDVFRSPSARPILVLGLLLLVFLLWLMVAQGVYRATFGEEPFRAGVFLDQLFTTGHGWALIIVGNLIGAAFAVAVFAASVVSFPMLVDRKVPVGTAVGTSVRAVLANPGPMVGWGLVVVTLLALGSVPLFVGLAVVLPVLGHATWHLYRKVVEA
jgi:uncharacterized membrane protein